MMKQYLSIKKDYQNAILFFRLGDFYEMFMKDAETASKVLSIALTSRSKGKDKKIPMCGVPFHAAESYIAKLTRANYKVAICEQVSDPNLPGIVEREVVRVITPGTVTDENALDKSKNNFIAALLKKHYKKKEILALCYCDISTGDFYLGELNFNLSEILGAIEPAEIILPSHLYNNPKFLQSIKDFSNNLHSFGLWENYFAVYKNHPLVKDVKSSAAKECACALLGYLEETQKTPINHITKVSEIISPKYARLDSSAITNLEIFKTFREGDVKGSLISVLDKTKTPMGARTLRRFILNPLKLKKDIDERLNGVEELIKNRDLLDRVSTILSHIYDIERALAKLTLKTANPKDLISIKYSLKGALHIKSALRECESLVLKKVERDIKENISEVILLVERVLVEEPPFSPKEGGLVNAGVDEELDSLKDKIKDSTKFLAEMEFNEKERTGINSLKVRFNKVYGYYIEVSKSNLYLVPNHYIRKQTLVNAERFVTEKLKEHEELVLNAKELINRKEYEIYLSVISKVLEYTTFIKEAALAIGLLDTLAGFAVLSKENEYTKPHILFSDKPYLIDINDGRHPVIETLIPASEFIPNSVLLSGERQILIITGPNMSGKSTFIRQTALIVLMAQIGCFVPAVSAKISPVDRIFTRIGASDVLSSGLSTFMVEMMETANILNNATDKSLVILDEVGRGTSTYDGVSIAWAIVEYLAKKVKAKTLFATHYHELLKLSEVYENVSNFQVAVEEEKTLDGEERITFLYKVIKGGASKSYGIHVAKLAGLPDFVVKRALNVLKLLEQRKIERPNDNLANNNQLTIDL